MKTISIFQVQDINNLLKERQFDYILKLRDACGSQSLYLELLKNDYLQVIPGTINPYNLLLK